MATASPSNSTITNIIKNEGIIIIWFDASFESCKDNKKIEQQLSIITDNLHFETNLEICVNLIQTLNQEKIFLITSGSQAEKILPNVVTFSQIKSVIIYDKKSYKYQHLFHQYKKIIGMYDNIDQLRQKIELQIYIDLKQNLKFSYFDQVTDSIKSLSQDSADFLLNQILKIIIPFLPTNQNERQQMIQIFKQCYDQDSTQMKLIEQFEKEYQSKDAIKWYLKTMFIYKLVHGALTTHNFDLLFKCRFFISDLSECIKQESEKYFSSNKAQSDVYCGMKLDRRELDKMKASQNRLILINGYFSTTQNRSLACDSAMKSTTRTDVIPVLFHIQLNRGLLERNVRFADVSSFSEYPNEEEVLFDLNTCFRIESIEEERSLTIIKMNASNDELEIAKHYIDLLKKESGENSMLILYGRLLCDLNKYDKSEKYFQLLRDECKGEHGAVIEFNLGRILQLKRKLNDALTQYEHAYKLMSSDITARTIDRAHVLHNMGLIYHEQRKFDDAIQKYEEALQIKGNIYPVDHYDILRTLTSIIDLFKEQKRDNDCLSYHQRALDSYKQVRPSDVTKLADCYINIAEICIQQKNYEAAFVHSKQVLEISERLDSSIHIRMAKIENEIGTFYLQQQQYNDALPHFQKTLEILDQNCPNEQPEIIYDSYVNSAMCYENINEPRMARECYLQAKDHCSNFLANDHQRRETLERNILRLQSANNVHRDVTHNSRPREIASLCDSSNGNYWSGESSV